MCRPKQRTAPHVRGNWHGRVPQPNYAWSPNPGYAFITFSSICSSHKANPRAPTSTTGITTSDVEPTRLPKRLRFKRCLIDRLPMEILLQIIGYLVPTGASFHIFLTTTTNYGGGIWTILHKFCKEPSDVEQRVVLNKVEPITYNLTALARTCRVLSEAYHTTMYGYNHFIFELSSDKVYPIIEGAYPPRVESWTKRLRGSRPPMWPLTENTVPYVKNLTILGSLGEARWAKMALRQQILPAVRLSKLAQQLNGFTVDLRSGLVQPNPKFPPPVPGVGPNGRLAWGVRGPEDTVLRLRNPITSDDQPGLEEFWELFEDVRGVRDVVLSGHISAEMAKELHAKMTSERVPPVVAKAASKPQASSSKRKRVGEPQREVKSRRKA